MIYLTKEELKAIIMIRELLSKEMKTPKSKIYAWELFDDYVNLDDFTSAVLKIKEGISMITINLSDKQAAELKSMMNSFMPTRHDSQRNVVDEVSDQINNQQFDVIDFESSRHYEVVSVNAAYLTNWDEANKK